MKNSLFIGLVVFIFLGCSEDEKDNNTNASLCNQTIIGDYNSVASKCDGIRSNSVDCKFAGLDF